MKKRFLENLDFQRVNVLLEGFNKTTGFVTAILDLDGNILSKSGWRAICTEFHRMNPQSARNCVISDTVLASQVTSGEKYHFYQCKNGLVDVVVPIVIRGEHVANLFSGQFFFETPDVSYFKEQAKCYGFDEELYLQALDKVPVFSKEKVETVMDFLLIITQMITEMTYEKLEQIELNAAIRSSEAALRESQDRLKQSMDDLLASQRIAHVGTWRLDLATNEVVWSDELYRIYGFDPTTPPPLFTEHMKLFTPESWEKCAAAIEHARTTGSPYELELETVKADGSIGWMWVRGEATVDTNGQIVSLWGAAQDITARKRIEMQLSESRELMESIIENTTDAIYIKDLQGRYLLVNSTVAEVVGKSKEALLGQDDYFLFPAEEAETIMAADREVMNGDVSRTFEEVGTDATGKINFYSSTKGPIYDENKKVAGIFGIARNITAQKELEQKIERERKLLEATLISVGDGVISTDIHGNVQFMNPVAERLTGWSQDEARGLQIEEIFNIVNEVTGENCESITKLVFHTGKTVGLESHTLLVSKTGDRRPIEDCASPIKMENGKIIGVVVVFSDFSEKRKRMEEIEYLSYHDYLTGLYNRRFFEEELKRYDVSRNLPLSIVMGDVNGLKLVNDSFGHAVGDQLLKMTSELILKVCRQDDVVSRLGGDEFVVLLPGADEASAEGLIQRIQEAFADEEIEGIPLSVSFGFATKQQETEDLADILRNAEDHMYRHKLYESAGARSKTVNLIINTLYAKNNREMRHSQRVGVLSASIAAAMGFAMDDVNRMRTAGLMHDIGKIGIEDQILNKAGRLSEQEWDEIKKHSEIGYRILSSVPEFSEIANFVLEHQERWDGSGYPRGLKGREISIEARIIAVADSFDAMTGERTYGSVFSEEEAIRELRRCAGTQFDADVVDAFSNNLPQEKPAK